MARFVQWPLGIYPKSITPVGGPRTSGDGEAESLTGFMQTGASVFGLWQWKFTFPAMKGMRYRRFSGFVAAMHNGANATRYTFLDPDRITLAEAGVTVNQIQENGGIPWSNGKPWSNGMNWACGYPHVPVAAAGARFDSEIKLGSQFWGNTLLGGEYIGFGPFYLGAHKVTEVISPGRYRIWPPLRADITTSNYATMRPVIALRLAGRGSTQLARATAASEESTLVLLEVEDRHARALYTG